MNGRRPAEDAADGESESKKARITIALSDDEPEENGAGGSSEGAPPGIPTLKGQLEEGNHAADIPPTLLEGKGKGRQMDADGTSSMTGSNFNGGTGTQNEEAGPSTADATTSTPSANPAPPAPLPKRKDPEAALKPPSSSTSAETILDLFRQDFLDRETTKEHVLALEGDDMKTIVRKKVNVLKCLHFGRPLAPLLGIDSDDLMTDSESEGEEEEEEWERQMEAIRKELRWSARGMEEGPEKEAFLKEIDGSEGEEREKTAERTKEKKKDQHRERRQKQKQKQKQTQETTQEQTNEQTSEQTNEQTNGRTNGREKEQTNEQTNGREKEQAEESISLKEKVREEAGLRALEKMKSDELRGFLSWKDETIDLPPFDPIKDRNREAREADKDISKKRERKLVALNELYRVAPGTYDLANLEWFETHIQLRSELSALMKFLFIEESLMDLTKRGLVAEERKKANLERAQAAAEKQKKLDMDQSRAAATATTSIPPPPSKKTQIRIRHTQNDPRRARGRNRWSSSPCTPLASDSETPSGAPGRSTSISGSGRIGRMG
ncbi:unnamed protein product [Tilletia laevis]|uniref:Uncharacterized protein n=2 Tax=Tilletia TaxID=13289 RepID=A0A8X7MRW6_9BASI|nr:hypothetical protein CF336_g7517 [Tilletia laevis]KAE8247001.1 hypothetical protein A4X06_0g4766 [Tilletia controversa]KAE8247103.1 hypothetical protein A4X03_0g7139 [Tilletia caries]KAE8188427.1 hypothetical protein CF335_g6898 [Tilletia laevis]CAD6888492.1 unnamed protein product [Tilletia caries]